MSEKIRFHRRSFLAALLGLGFLAQIRPHQNWTSLTGQTTLEAQLVKLLRHRDSARVIGLEYLQSTPAEADQSLLVDLLSPGFVDESGNLASLDIDTLRQRLRQRIRQDFEEERLVKLQGWLLSVTEARLCALVTVAT